MGRMSVLIGQMAHWFPENWKRTIDCFVDVLLIALDVFVINRRTNKIQLNPPWERVKKQPSL